MNWSSWRRSSISFGNWAFSRCGSFSHNILTTLNSYEPRNQHSLIEVSEYKMKSHTVAGNKLKLYKLCTDTVFGMSLMAHCPGQTTVMGQWVQSAEPRTNPARQITFRSHILSEQNPYVKFNLITTTAVLWLQRFVREHKWTNGILKIVQHSRQDWDKGCTE